MTVNDIFSRFAYEGEIKEIKPLGEGFINDTFIVRTVGDALDYILQRKNHNVFPDVPAMMDNIVKVTAHMKAKIINAGGDPMRESLTVVFAKDGKPYFFDAEEGNYWAVCVFIAGSVTIDAGSTTAGARRGQYYAVFREGAPIRDLHGNVLDAERDYIAVIQITDARPQYSKAKIIRGRGVRRGDGIELIRKPDQVRLIGE